jgi:hypothetical protein
MDISRFRMLFDALPEPVSLHTVNRLAEIILRLSRGGESNPGGLQRLALLELQIGPES